jgi:hypothetical protein
MELKCDNIVETHQVELTRRRSMLSASKPRIKVAMLSLALISIVLGILSCDISDIIDFGELSPEDQQATVQSMIETEFAALQTPSATSEPTVTPQMLDCSGATFTLDPSVAASAPYELVPQEVGDPGIPFTINPEYVQYPFQGYVLADTFHDPIIRIYPVDEFVALLPSVADTVNNLEQLLINQPAAPQNAIPFLPIWNAAQMVRAKVMYLNFQNGSGVRFVSQYGQAYWLVNNHDMFYTFQGLTNDGACYISVILPASNPALPAQGGPPPGQTEAEILAYYDAIVPQLNAMSDASFTPDFSVLDAMIASMLVQ